MDERWLNRLVIMNVEQGTWDIQGSKEELEALKRLARLGLWAEKTRFAIESVLWVDQCRCDAAYTERHRHAPNTYCGELDPLRDALAALPKEKK